MKKLTRDFFARPTLDVARDLLGKRLHFHDKSGLITETEAYIGSDDPACHAARGMTPRNQVMFGPPGHAYVYFIYGMYFCLNFVAENEGFPAAVLIRGIETSTHHFDGPGKLCRALDITKSENNTDLCTSDHFFVTDENHTPEFKSTPRIGIKVGTDKFWRFVSISPPCRGSACRPKSRVLGTKAEEGV